MSRRSPPGRTLAVAPSPTADAAGHVERGRPARPRRRSRTPSRRCSRRSSITAPASRTSASRGRDPVARAAASTCSARTTCSRRVRAAGLDCPVLVTGSALVYRASTEPARRGRSDRPVEPVRRQQARAGNARAARADVSAGASSSRPFNHAGPRQSPAYVTSSFARQIAEIEAGRARAGAAASATSTRDATSPTFATRCAPTGCWPTRAGLRRPYNVCAGGPIASAICSICCWRGRATADQDRESIPTRLRPSDNPVIARRSDRASSTETGWQPRDPDRATRSTDLLDYWRHRVARRARVMAARPHAERQPQSRAHRDGRLRAAAAIPDWWQAAMLAVAALASTCSCCRGSPGTSIVRASSPAAPAPASSSIRCRCSARAVLSPTASTSSPPHGAILAVGDGMATLAGTADRLARAFPWNR